jgi:hypothetical protein
MQRSEEHIKVVNGVQAVVEAIGNISLELANGFMTLLKMFYIFLHYTET